MTLPALLSANLIALIFIGLTLSRIATRLRASTSMQREVLQMLVIAHADACEEEPVEQHETEGQAA